MKKPTSEKIKPLILLLLILTSMITALSLLYGAKAEVSIISLTPTYGYVGDTVWVTANTTTENVPYEILFDQISVYNGTAVGNLINASFIVPHAVKGSHNVTVRAETEATATFIVETKYSMEMLNVPEPPLQLQQNDTVNISLNVTGGESDASYIANMTVNTPANVTYAMNASLETTTEPGNYIATIDYPSTQWTTVANTNYTGIYAVSWVNATDTLASATFFVGLTNSSQYHRGNPVDIKAVDYSPGQEVNITITGVDSYFERFNTTANGDGVIHYTDWSVPQNATIGNYTLSITPVPTSKQNANDTQTFEIPGFEIEIFTLNLANRTVSDVFLKAYDNSTSIYYNATSGVNGSATLTLEKGFHNFEAFFKEVRVGEMNLTIEKKAQENITCQLTTANINVMDERGVKIPFVSIDLTYNYTTTETKENRTETYSGETNITGTLQLHALLPNLTYTINASRYGKVFNYNNNTIPCLPAEAYENITILCPTKRLQVEVIDANNNSIQGVMVKAQEFMGGLNYSNATDDSGTAILGCTFGKYMVKVCHGEISLYETTLELFEHQNITMKCQLYGLTVSVKIVDFFGQPISNANVTLQREGMAPNSSRTQSDGKVTFDNIIGGKLWIAVYLFDETQPFITRELTVSEPTTIEIKIDKYVLLAGFFVETNHLTTAIIIAVIVILVLSIEVYRKKRFKPQKSES